MSSEVRVNQLQSAAGLSTVTLGIGVTFNSSVTIIDSYISTINNGPLAGLKNKIMNGEMVVDQRNLASGVNLNTSNPGAFVVDRFGCACDVGVGQGTINFQRNSTSAGTMPNGTPFALYASVQTNKATLVANDLCYVYQGLEGYNVQDFQYGTANAKTVTLSFWVRANTTGTYSGSVRHNTLVPNYRSYVFTYTINSSNTWEYKTIIIPGDVSATPAQTVDGAYYVFWDLGSGSTYTSSTTNSWQNGNFIKSTGSVSLIQGLLNSWWLTNVQLEIGPVATPYERIPVGLQLELCRRYYQNRTQQAWHGNIYQSFTLSPAMRIAPTITPSVGTVSAVDGYGWYGINGSTSAFSYTAAADI